MYQYRCYIKDSTDLTAVPKAFMTVPAFTIRRDLLATANSSFTVTSVPSNVDNNDILCLYDPCGTVIYQGVINQISDQTIQCNQIQSIFKGTWLCETIPSDYLEHEVAQILEKYASGVITDSVTDTLMASKLGVFDIEYVGSNTNNLPAFDPQTTQDMESFIYSLYEKYNIVLEFDIPKEGTPKVTVRTVNYTPYKIANNTHAIVDISPLTEIAQNNKLVVYSSEGAFRAVYYATSQGIVTDSTDPLRLKSINTIIQFTDDELDAVVASNLSSEMYNHKLTFTLRLDNNLYKWSDWRIGQPLEIWFNSEYFNSVFTGYELTKQQNTELTEVYITCGKVRTSLTNKLSLGGIK